MSRNILLFKNVLLPAYILSLTTILQPRTQNLSRHFTRIPILHSPWQKCLLSQIKRLFPPSPIAMLFAATQEMSAWAAKPKQHCTRGGEGGEFDSFGHDGTMARNWKLYWNVSTVLSGVVATNIVLLTDIFWPKIFTCSNYWRRLTWSRNEEFCRSRKVLPTEAEGWGG